MKDFAQPAWAREDAFPLKPDQAPYGCRDDKGKLVTFDDLDGLKKYLSAGKGKLAWVWVPEHERLIAPEEFPPLANALKKRRLLFAEDDFADGKRNLLIFGGVLIWAIISASRKGSIVESQTVGVAALLFLFFVIRPFLNGRSGIKGAKADSAESIAGEIPEARFELWLGAQKSWFTIALMGLLLAVGTVQMITGGGIQEAGLVKSVYALGERWRLFTAAFLHGHFLHFLMNASALWYLARRVEILSRWPHLVAVFFISILGAGWATTAWIPVGISVGVSGAVCGLLGFLLVFETLHRPLVPQSARHRLMGILVSLVVIGALGFRFIDNAAHFGGLAAGATYGLIVFPKSSSPHRPGILKRDLAFGGVAAFFICVSGIGAIVAMLVL